MSGVQAKACNKEMTGAQEAAQTFMKTQDPKYACAALTFC